MRIATINYESDLLLLPALRSFPLHRFSIPSSLIALRIALKYKTSDNSACVQRSSLSLWPYSGYLATVYYRSFRAMLTRSCRPRRISQKYPRKGPCGEIAHIHRSAPTGVKDGSKGKLHIDGSQQNLIVQNALMSITAFGQPSDPGPLLSSETIQSTLQAGNGIPLVG